MKIFVAVDMEGISGIFQSEQVSPGSRLYEEGRRFLTQDVNACVEGCFAGGAEQVVVRDIHGGGNHFVWEDLDPRAEYVRGATERERLPGIAQCAGLILLGYHAMAGTREAILEHTMSSRGWQSFRMNGQLTGEVGIDAGIAADHGVPTIMVSGDDKVCKEVKRLLKGVVVAQVKRCSQEPSGRHASAVQGSPSSGQPPAPTQTPPVQVSPTVHASPSSQAVPSQMGSQTSLPAQGGGRLSQS